MQDDSIIALYWQRDENAIRETERKYGHYLMKIARNILSDLEDSRESVNETYFRAWNSMPPHRPDVLSTYLGKIARQLSIDRFRRQHSTKRKASEYAASLSELEECLSAGNNTEQEVNLHLLAEAIQEYLSALPAEARDVFLGRYYFADSIREVADYCHFSISKTKSMLHRVRAGLRRHLEQEGFFDET